MENKINAEGGDGSYVEVCSIQKPIYDEDWRISKKKSKAGVILHRERKDGESEFLIVRSAYGVGKWGFPKGSVEDGEDIQAAAWRELYEETGIRERDVDIVEKNTTVYDGIFYIHASVLEGLYVNPDIKEVSAFAWVTHQQARSYNANRSFKSWWALLDKFQKNLPIRTVSFEPYPEVPIFATKPVCGTLGRPIKLNVITSMKRWDTLEKIASCNRNTGKEDFVKNGGESNPGPSSIMTTSDLLAKFICSLPVKLVLSSLVLASALVGQYWATLFFIVSICVYDAFQKVQNPNTGEYSYAIILVITAALGYLYMRFGRTYHLEVSLPNRKYQSFERRNDTEYKNKAKSKELADAPLLTQFIVGLGSVAILALSCVVGMKNATTLSQFWREMTGNMLNVPMLIETMKKYAQWGGITEEQQGLLEAAYPVFTARQNTVPPNPILFTKSESHSTPTAPSTKLLADTAAARPEEFMQKDVVVEIDKLGRRGLAANVEHLMVYSSQYVSEEEKNYMAHTKHGILEYIATIEPDVFNLDKYKHQCFHIPMRCRAWEYDGINQQRILALAKECENCAPKIVWLQSNTKDTSYLSKVYRSVQNFRTKVSEMKSADSQSKKLKLIFLLVLLVAVIVTGIVLYLRNNKNKTMESKGKGKNRKVHRVKGGYDAFQDFKYAAAQKGLIEYDGDRVYLNGEILTYNDWADGAYDIIGYPEENEEIIEFREKYEREYEKGEDQYISERNRRIYGLDDSDDDRDYEAVKAYPQLNCEENRDFLKKFVYDANNKEQNIFQKNIAVNAMRRGIPIDKWNLRPSIIGQIKNNLPLKVHKITENFNDALQKKEYITTSEKKMLESKKISSGFLKTYKVKESKSLDDQKMWNIEAAHNKMLVQGKDLLLNTCETFKQVNCFDKNNKEIIPFKNVAEAREMQKKQIKEIELLNEERCPHWVKEIFLRSLNEYYDDVCAVQQAKEMRDFRDTNHKLESKAATIIPDGLNQEKVYKIMVDGEFKSCAMAVPGGFLLNSHAVALDGHVLRKGAPLRDYVSVSRGARSYKLWLTPDAVHQFKTHPDLMYVRCKGVVSTRRLTFGTVGSQFVPTVLHTLRERNNMVDDVTQNGNIRRCTANTLETDISTEEGMCGGFYVTNDGIVGVHYAGGNGLNEAIDLTAIREEWDLITNKDFF